MSKATPNSYGQILKSSSIVGGAQGINYAVGMVRTKLVAILLGTSGVGLIGLYLSVTGLLSTLAQMGIDQSGVREVAEANAAANRETVAQTTKTLQRVCWITGVLGWLLAALLAWPLSQWAFGTTEQAGTVAVLGAVVFLGAISAGQSALLQGMRRIGDLARMQVLSALAATLLAVGLYAWLGERGIIPVLILTAAVQLGCSWYYARRVELVPVVQSWRATAQNSGRLLQLGAAFMYGALLNALVGVAIRTVIVRKLGIDANGVYQAAWGISGMFAGFIVTAMGTDFYPRLTAVAGDDAQVNRLVNEQTEIGILLALPGLIGTLVFAPEVMRVFYSVKFLPGAELLPWFVLSSFVQVFIFPMGFIARAKGATFWVYVAQTWSNASYLVVALAMLSWFGLPGIGYATLVCISLFCVLIFFVARHLSGFGFVPAAGRLFGLAALLILFGLAVRQIHHTLFSMILGTLVTFAAGVVSLRGIAARLGREHRVVRLVCRLPGGAMICGVAAETPSPKTS